MADLFKEASERSTKAYNEQNEYLLSNGVMPEYNNEEERQVFRARLVELGWDPDEVEDYCAENS